MFLDTAYRNAHLSQNGRESLRRYVIACFRNAGNSRTFRLPRVVRHNGTEIPGVPTGSNPPVGTLQIRENLISTESVVIVLETLMTAPYSSVLSFVPFCRSFSIFCGGLVLFVLMTPTFTLNRELFTLFFQNRRRHGLPAVPQSV